MALASARRPAPLNDGTGCASHSRSLCRATHLLYLHPKAAIRSILSRQSRLTQFRLRDGCTVSSCQLPFRVAESPVRSRLIVRLVRAKGSLPGVPFPGGPEDPQAYLPLNGRRVTGGRYRVSEKPSRSWKYLRHLRSFMRDFKELHTR